MSVDYEDVRNQVSFHDALELLEIDPPARFPGHVYCPVHDEDTPSCWITDDHFYCFGCGENGDVLKFVALTGGISIPQAAEWLAGTMDWSRDLTVVERSRQRPLPDLKPEFDDLVRGCSPYDYDMAIEHAALRWPWLELPWLEQRFGVRVAPYNLLIPHSDDLGVMRGVKRRALPSGNKRSLDGSVYTESLYYARPWAPTTSCVLVEGESDCWTLTKHYGDRVQVYALPSGAQLWRPVFAEQLRRHELIWMAPDHDEAGQSAWDRVRLDVPEVRRLEFPAWAKDVTEAYAHGWRPVLL